MIKNFKDSKLEQCWKYDKCRGLRADLKRRVLLKLDSMDVATNLDDLKNPPSNRLHQLKGKHKNYWAISVNGPWRLIFRFENNDVFDVELIQYH